MLCRTASHQLRANQRNPFCRIPLAGGQGRGSRLARADLVVAMAAQNPQAVGGDGVLSKAAEALDLPVGMRPCCMSGSLATGTPVGSFAKIGGVDCYVSKPKQPNGAAVVICPDIFGAQFLNTQLIADQMAEAGFLTVIVDYFQAKALPAWVMEELLALSRPDLERLGAPSPPTFLDTWVWGTVRKVRAVGSLLSVVPAFIMRQGAPAPISLAKVPQVEGVIRELRAGAHGPVSKVGAVGYCYGGGYPLVLARGTEPPPASASMTQDCLVDAIAVAHTTIKVPDFLAGLQRPTLIVAAENDFGFSDEARAQAERLFEVMGSEAGRGPFNIKYYPGTFHGFATRGYEKDPVVAAAKEDALRQMIAWFNAHLLSKS